MVVSGARLPDHPVSQQEFRRARCLNESFSPFGFHPLEASRIDPDLGGRVSASGEVMLSSGFASYRQSLAFHMRGVTDEERLTGCIDWSLQCRVLTLFSYFE